MEETSTTPWSGWEDDESESKDRVREQLSEMRNREEGSGESAEPQPPPKRKRGRPRKNPNEPKKPGPKRRKPAKRDSSDESNDDGEFSLDDGEDELLEEEDDEPEEPEDDPNDPEFEPNRRTSRRLRKPVKTYNTKALLREEMSKARETFKGSGRGRGRPRGSGRKQADLSFLDAHSRRSCVSDANELEKLLQEEVSLYEQHLPTLPPVIPDPSQRLYVVRVDSVDALVNAGAGFRLMTSCITDDMMVSLFHLTTDRYFVNNNAEDVVQLAQVLRHVWNQLPLKKRIAWENAARKAALESNTTRDDDESAGEEDVHVRSEVMPLREFPFGMNLKNDDMLNDRSSNDRSWRIQALNGPTPSDMVRKQRAIESSCCEVREMWKSFINVQSHLLAGHYTAMFYACHFCGVLYHSVETLLGHADCPRWTSMLLTQMVKGGGKQIRKVEMKVAYLFMVCTDCGLWLPIRVNYPPDRLPKAWCFFATVMESHSCKKLVPLLVYMAENMDVPSRDARLLIHFVPSFLKDFPISCEECQINAFVTPDEMDLHFQRVHHIKFKCTKCGECSGTEMYHKAHLASHLSDSLLLADYLRTSCTFHPPPHCGGPPVVGANRKIAASGGITTTITPCPLGHDLIDHCEPLVEAKILNALDNAKVSTALSEEETDEEESGSKQRPDMGFENYEYSELEVPHDEKEAKKEINQYFHNLHGTSEADDDVLDWRTRVNNYKEVVDVLKNPVQKIGIDFSELTKRVGSDKFADMLVAKFTKRISLPISACMELLSGNLLLKRFMYCTACNTILASQSGIDVHSKSKCGADTLVSLYCPPAPINSEVKCPNCPTSVCSISGFRAHMAIQHGIYVEYKAGAHTGVAPESNASLQDIAARVPDTRSAVARDTDNALWLRYGLLQPRSHFDMQLKLAKKGIKVIGMDRKENGGPSPSSHNSPRVAQRTPVTVRRTAFTLNDSSPPIGMDRGDDGAPIPASALAQGINQHYIKPFVLVNNMLRCKFCAHQTSTPQMMRDHLQSNHVLVCRACGNGFAHREALARHGKMGRCSMFFKDASVKQISADCGVCKKRMSLANAYLHLFREHLSAVMYGTVSGQVYPEHLNLHVDATLADVIALPVKEVTPFSSATNHEAPRDRTNKELVIYKTPKGAISSCYLCGMQMASLEQMGRHLSRHPERWTRCPFCIDYVPIAGHEAMKAHLSQRHMEKRDGNLSCRYCQRLLSRGSYAHLLYMCTQTRKCALCRGDQCMKNAAEMTVHWTNKHLDILRRFQCSDCGMTFCHVDDFYGHQCRSHFMQQKCSCGFGVVFSSRTAFLLHFGMHIDEANMICKLCNFKFSSRVALQNHRLSHAIMMNGPNGRQMIILDTKLVVPELPGGEEKRPRRSKELDALIEEKRLNVDVTLVLRNIVRQVCESLGETYDQLKDSPPPPEHLAAGDDDIIEIDSPRVDDDLVGSAEPLTDAQQAALSAEVRVEAADFVGEAGSGMPGYVEDDDDEGAVECISAESGEKTVSAPAVVKEVHDDNDDDELQVVGEVEYVPGSSTTTVSSREKKYKCSKCSCTFITAHAAKIHEDTSHSTDAGGICDKVFGIPLRGFFFVCRNCCAAFESQQQFKTHRLSHGPTGSVSCGECSAIAYNTPLFEHHRNAHATKDRLFYGCSQCSMMFRTDARLMFHLREAHGVPLFFFCKACHLGGTHERTIYAHVSVKSQRCRQFGMQKNWTSIMTIGVCPANVLHYQPKNIVTHEVMVSRGSVEVVVPSECSHRSFLAPTDSLITCRECFCTMTAASFTAAEAYRNGGVSKELAMSLDNGLDFPFTAIYDPCDGVPPSAGRAIAPRPLEPQLPSCHLGNGIRSTESPRLAMRPPQTASGARVAAVAPLMNTLKRRSAAQGSNSDIITLSDEEPGPSAAKRLPPSAQKSRMTDNNPGKCKVCDAPMPSAQIQSLHELHKNGMKWFCLDCASAQMDEVEAMKHYFTVHVKVAEQRAIERGQLFRPLHYELQCPFPKCREPLSTLTNLRIHINNKHRTETAYTSSACMFRFCSPFAKSKHDGQHSTYESVNGVEGTCCPLCGTLNQWNIQMPGSTYTMSHIAVHGLRRYHMCRDCFVCFKGDYDVGLFCYSFLFSTLHILDMSFYCFCSFRICFCPLRYLLICGSCINDITQGKCVRTPQIYVSLTWASTRLP
ncbi:hypothetical protein Y032_0023g778 [Ancylostoma ceylanicum]|uniref:C2H2-type domain-containing protein n=1 Tax=Ancylostoma ceylanicum TaxID=53326 RepID=A0A016UXJ4_9BILA|nr:hypothetical protein Y032_0023g778 [Ancylostoma ceylanicum]